MKQISLPPPSFFGLNSEQCLIIENKINDYRPENPPLRLPPPILSENLKNKLIEESAFLTKMIFSVQNRIFNGDYFKLAAALKVDQKLGDLMEKLSQPHWQLRADKFYRPDYILTQSGLRMVENNIDTNLGGIGICDFITRKFHDQGNITNQFLVKNKIYTDLIDLQWNKTLHNLLSTKKNITNINPVFYSASHSKEAEDDFITAIYNAAIINSGFKLLCGPLAALEIHKDKVTFKGTEVDLVYNDFSFTEYLDYKQPLEQIHALINADEQNQILYLSPPAGMVFDNKAILSYLTDSDYKECFSSEEWKRLQALIPATHIVNEHNINYCLHNRENLILKPGFEFGGRNVFFGADLDEDKWATMIYTATQTSLPTVVQKVVDNQIKVVDPVTNQEFHFCLSPLFFGNEYAGCLYRESIELTTQNPVINASRGSRVSTVYTSHK